ncbi:MAG: GGDEF domain-containing protein [Rhodocyclales bacterium]|nr:GGDEF domain-containing protein [Rhodocyclales bacterium]
MRYQDSAEQSAEFLRLALPLMSRQRAGLHPISYAIWYEYVSGTNAALRAGVDERLRTDGSLDDAATHELYQKHVAEINEDVARQLAAGFQKVMADMSLSAAQAGDKASEFGNALGKLSADLAPAGADEGVTAVLTLTRDMQGSIVMLKSRLDESRNEIEQLRSEVVKARSEALADGLTGLVNRRGFEIAINACLGARGENDVGPSLLMADIDHFKQVNDTYGHVFGDKVLRAVAQILQDNVKGKDTAARYGGEEFVVLLPDTPLEGARQLAERIRGIVERCRIKRSSDQGAVANITVSLGAASFRAGERATDFIARADAALYTSKTSGRNRVTVAET